MEHQNTFATEGLGPTLDDLALIAQNAALADDHVFSTLLQPPRVVSGSGKYIIDLYAPGFGVSEGLVLPSGLNDASVNVNQFRAFMGPLQADWKSSRSEVFVGSNGFANQAWQFTPTASNNRWDLLYVQMDRDVAEPAVIRAVKDTTSQAVTSKMVSVVNKCVLTLKSVQGAEAATPIQPVLPPDSVTTVNIPLAYVRLTHPHTLSTQITKRQILDAAPRLPIAPRTGALSARPASCQNTPGGSILASITAGIGVSGVVRPPAFIPASTSGFEMRTVALQFNGAGTGRSIGLNTTTVVDDSIDWRNRIFRSNWYAGSSSPNFAWDTSGAVHPGPGRATFTLDGVDYSVWGNSFQASSTWNGEGVANAGPVAKLLNNNMSPIAAGANLWFFVDMTDGKLKVKVDITDPAVALVGFVMATGPNPNVGF